MSSRILVVDDETSVTDLIGYNLRKAHYEVLVAHDGEMALLIARESRPDLILLDLMLPKIDGLDVCRELRKSSQVPIIMVTARGEETDRVIGLELGADDYLCKPFSMRELLARIKAVLRRNRPGISEDQTSLMLTGPHGLELNEEARTVTLQGTPLSLTRQEFDLIQYLMINKGRVLSREQLLSQAWGYDFVGGTRAVDSAIKRLRKKFNTILPGSNLVETVREIGYRMVK
ncbi:MAG: response regulator transcription factor [Anaerolineales bacterium]|nr:MAG: response regulator transcription factor [Anaerolineales bacterium]